MDTSYQAPYAFEALKDDHSVYTQQAGSDACHILPQQPCTRSEFQEHHSTSVTSSSYQHHQHDTLQLPSLPGNLPPHSQPIHTPNIHAPSPSARLTGSPLFPVSARSMDRVEPRGSEDSPYPLLISPATSSSSNFAIDGRAYLAEVERRQYVLPSNKNFLVPALFGRQSHFDEIRKATTPTSAHPDGPIQYPEYHAVAPEHGSRRHKDFNANQLGQSSSHNNIARRRQSRRPSPLSPRLKKDDADGYPVERHHVDKGKGRADHSDNSPLRAFSVSQPQLTVLQSQSVESLEYDRSLQDFSTTSQAGLSRVFQPHPSLPPPTSTRATDLHEVATRTPEMTPSNQISLFSGSHGFAMHHPTFVVYPPGTASQQPEHSAALKWLQVSMIEHAQHDSAGRDPPPRCHPNTRITILERTHNWINNPQRQKRLLWIRGPAGVGKSAIVQTIADSLSASQRLGASLFLSRPNGRSNPQRVWPTIAYQLASRYALYRAYIEEIRPPDSQPLETKAMKEQFRLLIVEPLVNRKLLNEDGDILIAIDGLDECDGDLDYGSNQAQHRGRSLQQVHREIIELVSGFVLTHPSTPVIWVIASRPESHITAVFQSGDVKESYVEESILVDDKEACKDVERYLVASFKKIAEAYPSHITVTPWPVYAQFLLIAQAASGLFIFAEVVIRFIDDPEVQNPVSQLSHVLMAIDKLRRSKDPKNPLSALDVIYTAILARIPPVRMEDLKKLLSLAFYVNRKSIKVAKYKFRNMYEHFEITREDAITAFNYLHSVMYFPRVKDISETQPKFYHASFRDYLEDPFRSGEYNVAQWDGNSTWPIPATILRTHDWSDLSKTESWLCKIFEALSSSTSSVVIDTPPHPYEISKGQLQDILDGLNFCSLLLDNLDNTTFWYLHCMAITEISRVDELKRRGILRQTTLASLGQLLSSEIWVGQMCGYNYNVFDNARSGRSDSVTEEYATRASKTTTQFTKDNPALILIISYHNTLTLTLKNIKRLPSPAALRISAISMALTRLSRIPTASLSFMESSTTLPAYPHIEYYLNATNFEFLWSSSYPNISYRTYQAEDQRQFVPTPNQNLSNPAPFSRQSHFDLSSRATAPPSVDQNVSTQYLRYNIDNHAHGLRYSNTNQTAPNIQPLTPKYSSAHSNRPYSCNNNENRLHIRRPSPLSPGLKTDDADGYLDGERYHRDNGEGRADYLNDFRPRTHPVTQPQVTALPSRSVEDEHVRLFQGLSISQTGLTRFPEPQSYPAPPPASGQLSGPEMSSAHQVSLFSGSHGFAMHNPIFNVHPLGTELQELEHTAAMDWLNSSTIQHAQHDSAGRDPPPRCHPDTRISILERTHQWIDDTQRLKRLLWIRGPAGVGKSAIVQTVADSLSTSGHLIASLFFSRPNGRSNPQRVFPTIAYQLASQDSAYRAYIETIRPPDSQPLENKTMKEQFRLLIVDPLVKHKLFTRCGDVLIAIDGLDECDGDQDYDGSDQSQRRGRSLQQVHREIIGLISSFVCAHPSIPVIWIIASRPESHITSMFASRDVKDSYTEESISIDSEEARQDVERFLTAEFEKIAEAYPNHITVTPWPAYAQFLQVAQAASGLFIFAEVIIRFIDDPEVQNPISQLDHVLAAIAKLRQSRKPNNPLSALDVIYTAILDRIPPARMADLKKVLPLVFYVNRKSIRTGRYKFRNMYQHFDISREDAITSFNYLHSVICFPRAKDLCLTQPRSYHASFRDYLEDPSRSGEYAVEKWDASLTWPLPAAIIGTPEWSNLSKSPPHLCLLFQGLSPSGSVAKILLHRYEIPDGLLQDILDGLSFRSLLLENSSGHSFLDLHREATSTISCGDELKRRGILRQTTLASLRMFPSDEIWIGQLNQDKDYTVFDYQQSGRLDSVSKEYAVRMRAAFDRLLNEKPQTNVFLWGSQKAGQCAIIHEKDLPAWWKFIYPSLNRSRLTVVNHADLPPIPSCVLASGV
ncbi:hypothetical protein NP233_g4146 [Leucocoprinus birnbaumii]|uniref:NACHT domain-containing protein n=1 Tax=Leucocoprinus birnbaumii TaxID=56174 RepID=A0AAD5VV92_9AGAR|nr:hypothetical protein NP233_g4146 [Leucocoprinus birnbaumii]